VGAYFAVSLNDGYLEATLSPQRVPLTEYDRFQRLFHNLESRINDAAWHKLEFTMLGDRLGLFRLDDDESAKVRFPVAYWTEESALVFGNNVDLKSTDGSGFNMKSFRGCLRNVYANNRLINWQTTGTLSNIEVGCYSTRVSSAAAAPQTQNSDEADAGLPFINFQKGGCIRYTPPKSLGSERETIELQFRTSGDQLVLLDSTTSDFIIHTQGPALVVRSKDDITVTATVLGERGVSFSDNSWHRLSVEKADARVVVQVDGRYKQELALGRGRTRLGQVHVGCSRDLPRLKHKLNTLRDFAGSMHSVAYNGVDFVERLNQADPAMLVDGAVVWNNLARQRQQVDDAVSLLRDNSFVRLDRLSYDSAANLSFSFKTTESDGLLAFINQQGGSAASASQSNFLAVELVNGSVSLLLVGADRQSIRVQCPGSRFNDNKWHSVQVRRDRLGAPESGSAIGLASVTLVCDSLMARAKLPTELKLTSAQFTAGYSATSLPNELWLSKNPKYSGITTFYLDSIN
jgi:hypothetical protein